jgi:hypothetical protein
VTTAAAAATTAAPIFRLFDRNLAALHVATVELFDRLTGLIFGRHLDEAEATRTTGLAIGDDLGIRHGAEAAKQLAQVELGDAV